MKYRVPPSGFQWKHLDFLNGAMFWGLLISLVWFLNDRAGKPLAFFDNDAAFLSFCFGYVGIAFLIHQRHARQLLRDYGVDPHQVSWHARRRRDGFFFCPQCTSSELSVPDNFDPEAWVICNDCGHRITEYREWQKFAEEFRQTR